jgi:hypothetical protein
VRRLVPSRNRRRSARRQRLLPRFASARLLLWSRCSKHGRFVKAGTSHLSCSGARSRASAPRRRAKLAVAAFDVERGAHISDSDPCRRQLEPLTAGRSTARVGYKLRSARGSIGLEWALAREATGLRAPGSGGSPVTGGAPPATGRALGSGGTTPASGGQSSSGGRASGGTSSGGVATGGRPSGGTATQTLPGARPISRRHRPIPRAALAFASASPAARQAIPCGLASSWAITRGSRGELGAGRDVELHLAVLTSRSRSGRESLDPPGPPIPIDSARLAHPGSQLIEVGADGLPAHVSTPVAQARG